MTWRNFFGHCFDHLGMVCNHSAAPWRKWLGSYRMGTETNHIPSDPRSEPKSDRSEPKSERRWEGRAMEALHTPSLHLRFPGLIKKSVGTRLRREAKDPQNFESLDSKSTQTRINFLQTDNTLSILTFPSSSKCPTFAIDDTILKP